jgi:hypothetical protein
MKKRIPAWALAAALALASCAATERPAIEPAAFTPEVELTGRQVVPPNDSAATAVVRVALSGDQRLRIWLIVADMKPSLAHLHVGRPGSNGPLVARLERDGGELYVIRAPGLQLTPVQLSAYKAGNMYVVVSSARYPDGEIRAQLPGR